MIRFSLTHMVLIGFFVVNLVGCRHAQVKPSAEVQLEPYSLIKRDVGIEFVPGNKKVPANLLYRKVDHLAFSKSFKTSPFKMEFMVNPLMRNPVMTAKVMSKGKVLRHFVGKKTATSMISDKSTSWSPARSKIILQIPFINENEELVITTSYEWMDIRWFPAILLQDNGVLKESSLTIDVPYGTTMHFKTAKDRLNTEFLPVSTAHESNLWAQEDNRSGLGMRHVWKSDERTLSTSKEQGSQLQVLLSFETPQQNSANMKFDNWQVVASYLYDRIEQYDVPSNAIRDYTRNITQDFTTDKDKAQRIFTYLETVKKRSLAGSYQDQEVQPATRTFARSYGSPFDVAILGKAMLSSIGLNSDIVVASDKRYNPAMLDFYSPSLFNTVLLVLTLPGEVIYFDPESQGNHQLSPYLQGQQALLIRAKNSLVFALPYESADKNRQTFSYQLYATEEGFVQGEYSVDITGFFANSLKDLSAEQLRLAAPNDIENRVFGAFQTGFSWGTMQIEFDPSAQGYRIFGEISPKMLTKNEQGDYVLGLEKLTAPLMESLKNPEGKGFSHAANVSLFLSLPENYSAENVPTNAGFDLEGAGARFYASFGDHTLTLEAATKVSLPLKKEVEEGLKQRLQTLSTWQNAAIVIHDKNLVQGVFEDEQQPKEEATP